MFILNVKWLRNDNNHEVEKVTKMFHAEHDQVTRKMYLFHQNAF